MFSGAALAFRMDLSLKLLKVAEREKGMILFEYLVLAVPIFSQELMTWPVNHSDVWLLQTRISLELTLRWI